MPVTKSGDAEIIESGAAISYRGAPLTLSLRSLGVELVFAFADDDSGEPKVNIKGGPGSAEMTFTNFSNPLGLGFREPLKIAEADGKDVLVDLRVYKLEACARHVIYTIYRA